MNDTEKQDSRKTIIAFGAGLLIGALLVWAFSSTAPSTTKDDGKDDNKTNIENVLDNDNDNNDRNTDDEDTNTDTTTTDDTTTDNEGSFSVADQDAGNTVTLGRVSYPDGIGWVAVGDYEDGVAGNFLGAARYDVSAGLIPTEINLLRATTEGTTYRVSFFKDNGDLAFSRAGGDVEIANTAAYFTAE